MPGGEVLELGDHSCGLVVAHLAKAQRDQLITGPPIGGRGHPVPAAWSRPGA